MTEPIQTHAVLPGLLDNWGIPPEGAVYSYQTKIRQLTPRGYVDAYDGFQWTHLESTTCFHTLREAEIAAQDRAKYYGAIYTTRLRYPAPVGSSS